LERQTSSTTVASWHGGLSKGVEWKTNTQSGGDKGRIPLTSGYIAATRDTKRFEDRSC
jgi:hypothetical protein